MAAREAWQHLYDRRWRKSRRVYLAHNPLCVMCEREGRIEPATVVDHKIPHKGSVALFWDRGNWQGLCESHHNSDKQRMERVEANSVPHDMNGYRLGW